MRSITRLAYCAAAFILAGNLYMLLDDGESTSGLLPWSPIYSHRSAKSIHQVVSPIMPEEQYMMPEESAPTAEPTYYSKHPAAPLHSKMIVIGRTSGQNTTWLTEELADWPHTIYELDDSSAKLHTSSNKGGDGSAYLSFIVDNYDDLPDTILFMQNHLADWHVEKGLEIDNVHAAQALQILFVQRTGFASMRCIQPPGCPDGIQPLRNPPKAGDAEEVYAAAYQALFRKTAAEVPEQVAVAYSAQFAVSKAQVLERSKAEYKRYLNWLMETDLNDERSGLLMSYMWHIIFGMPPVHCPQQNTCYCDVYGICG